MAAEKLASDDPLYPSAIHVVRQEMRANLSFVQRRLVIGYNRAARMVEAMETDGIVGPLQSNGSRSIDEERLLEVAGTVVCDTTARCARCRERYQQAAP